MRINAINVSVLKDITLQLICNLVNRLHIKFVLKQKKFRLLVAFFRTTIWLSGL